MDNRLKIALVQFGIEAMNVSKNSEIVFSLIKESAKHGADLVLLPELWLLGVVSDPASLHDKALQEKIEQIFHQLILLASSLDIIIIGGMPLREDDVFFNALTYIDPNGDVVTYNKIHLFAPMGEDKVFMHGDYPQIFWVNNPQKTKNELGIGASICFDLRFPTLFKHLAQKGAEVMAVSALWPKQRIAHFNALCQARAIENQCFLMAANAVGSCGSHVFGGSSRIIAPSGKVLLDAGENEGVFVCDIEIDEVLKARSVFCTVSESPCLIGSKRKVITCDKLLTEVRRRKTTRQRMVFTNGCFDILHAGHVDYLEQARSLGDFLVVGLNSDASVKRLKGESRPVNDESVRAFVLSGLNSVDYVTIFNDDTPASLIAMLEPDVLVKGADWDEDKIVGADLVRAKGGKVARIPFKHETSTSKIVEKIIG